MEVGSEFTNKRNKTVKASFNSCTSELDGRGKADSEFTNGRLEYKVLYSDATEGDKACISMFRRAVRIMKITKM